MIANFSIPSIKPMGLSILFLSSILLFTGCAHENNYRGVPEAQWKKLTPEQKQLIVDQSYEEDVNGIK
jgi:hypothetical protein